MLLCKTIKDSLKGLAVLAELICIEASGKLLEDGLILSLLDFDQIQNTCLST